MNNRTDFTAIFSFCEDYRSRFNEQLDRRSSGPIPPSAEIAFNVRKIRREQDLILLGLASWWLGSAGFLLRENLREKLPDCQSEKNRIRLSLILDSKVASQEVFLGIYSERDFYGNQLPRLLILLKKLEVVLFKIKRARKVIRRRGYRDHGTLRLDCRWTETADFTFTEAQLENERKNQELQDTLDFLIGFCTL